MRIATIVLAGILLAGCQERDAGPADALARPDADRTAETPFFLGRWAAKEEMCKEAAWEFTATGLSTPGHTVCTFDRIEETGGIYHIEATCTAEGPPAGYDLAISYAQSAGALLVEGGPFEPIGLVACD